MKINIFSEENDSISSHHNIKLGKDFTSVEDFKKCLDDNIDDGEASEIRVIDVIEYFPANISETVTGYILSKLAHNGKMLISGIDFREVSRKYINSMIDVDEANLLLYGQQDEKWKCKKTSFTISQMVNFLQSKGLKITKKRIEDNRFIVEVIRV